MVDPWEKAYVYGRRDDGQVAHITEGGIWAICESNYLGLLSRTPHPYPVCRRCLRTKRAKELGL